MSWFNASQLSSFAKQALTSAQKSIDRVLDIKEEDQWGDSIEPTFTAQSSSTVVNGRSTWNLPSEECTKTLPPSSEAITKPVTRTVVDESEDFFSAFLPHGDTQTLSNTKVVSVPPAKSNQLVVPTETDGLVLTSDVSLTNVPLSSTEAESVTVFEPALIIDTKNSVKTLPVPPKEVLLESKDAKSEDRQSDTPSPPVSAFSSGTSTTSDIEVLDHESVLSESSASSRQETAEAKAGLHLMQGSFQLLSASTCADFPRLDEYPKLTESCGSSSDAFERIDSFSMQSLDSRSVSEVNSDDEIPGNRTLASITAGHLPTPAQTAPQTKQEEEEVMTESVIDQSLDDNEMEESGRSATPVNCEQTDELLEGDQEPESNLTLTSQTTDVNDTVISQNTEEKQGDSPCQIFELQKIIEELSSRLEKRESQLLVVSKDKARLEEECDNLKDEMISLKEGSSSVHSLKDEFTQRIAEAERKAQLACKERDIAKKEINGLREELASRLNSNETLELIKEKEEQIRELLEEGEKLSKQQLQHSNIIKKLRVKERESDSQITKQTKKLKEQEEELKHLQQVLDSKEEVEKQHRENIKKLNAVVERQEKELSKLQTSSEELQEKNRSLQAALDSSYKELAELHKANATKDSEAQELALSREVLAKEELSLALEKAQEESRLQQEALANQVADLRLALQRAEQQQAKKEDYLREEISELQQRLQEAETRNQELSQSVTSATRPLLRQIENLQATLGAQTASWEKLEKNISDRLGETSQLAVSVEKERSATEELLAIRAHIASLESQASLLRQEKGRLQGQLDAERMRREKLEDDFSRECVELENLKGEHARVLEEAKKEKLLLTNQLEMEKMKVDGVKSTSLFLFHQERKTLSLSVTDAPASSTPTLSRSSSVSGVENAGLPFPLFSQQEDSLDHSFSTMTMSISGTNLYEAARLGGGSSVIESLQSQLKLREGEIAQLQMEIASLERSRTVMAEELVRLTNQNDEMESKVQEIPRLKVQLKDLEQRHNTILQMYGEKAEEAEELRLDLDDVKNMYKTQIDELLKNQK
uniref:TATA element modulatory factor 1 n=1 Tax=Cyprinus carpio carpio TaxID=630221 RepID=A0A9J7YGK6_CYPCA